MSLEKTFEDALTALRKQRYNEAHDLFSDVMELEPEMPQVHYNMGLACGHLFRWRDAEESFRMALRIRQDPEYWIHLGLAHLHMKQWDEALRDFASALDLDPGSEIARAHLADLERFLDPASPTHAAVPFLCAGWFDTRLEDFVGIDPEIVSKAERVELRRYIADCLDGDPAACDDTHRFAEEWALRHGRDPLGVSRFLYERGLRCDCEVLREGDRGQPRPLGTHLL